MQIQLDHHRLEFIQRLSEIVERYDAFLLDIWGVLHDSERIYPGVIDCLLRLKDSGKKVILLSNAARRAAVLEQELTRFGITSRMYDHVVTSGEFFWQSFISGEDHWLKQLGSKYYLIGAESYNLTQGLPLNQVRRLDEADFVLTISVTGNPCSIKEKEPLLTELALRKLVMICVNPDLNVIRGGVMGIAAGAYAKKYQELGGIVHYYGKPHKPIYEFCLQLLQRLHQVSSPRTVGVGDGLSTDIAGASGCNLDSILVGTGIHGECVAGLPEDVSKLSHLCTATNQFPTITIPGLIW